MKFVVLSQRPELYSTQRVVKAVEARGHECQLIDYRRCYMKIASHRPTITYEGQLLEGVDAVIPRIAAAHSSYGTAVVRQFEMMNVYCVNGSQAIARARDKLRCLQILAKKGIGLPLTGYAHTTMDVAGLINVVGGAPLVIKLLEGTQGIGVVLTESEAAATSVIEAFRGLEANILVQEFIEEAKGTDLRCFVVGDKVVAAMMRKGAPGEFRSNLHRGGSAEAVKLTPEERSTAVRAAKAMGLRMAGVDILRSNHGPLVMEVNSSPGLEGIEKASGKDVANFIVEFIEKDSQAGQRGDRSTHH
ncbi:MAG: 30S ribosomal protein S6--L-glutamate ligase [Myxococcales bacterium]|nr:30S ribosomal protein S6--L-glutamate ligase [Myxococcales bacterium]